MLTVNMHEAKTQLSKLVEAALGGEEVVIAKAGKPAVRLVRVEPTPAPRPRSELLGMCRDEFWEAPDAWDPMSGEELAEWYDSPLFPEDREAADEK